MAYVIMCIVGFVSFAISVFSFAQIKGSFEYYASRGLKMTLITVISHIIIIAFCTFAVLKWLPTYKIAALIGAIIGFISLPRHIE